MQLPRSSFGGLSSQHDWGNPSSPLDSPSLLRLRGTRRQLIGSSMASLHQAGGPFLTPTTFTDDIWSPIIATAYLLSTMALSAMLSKRLPSLGSWSATPPARLAVVVLLADSCVPHWVLTRAY